MCRCASTRAPAGGSAPRASSLPASSRARTPCTGVNTGFGRLADVRIAKDAQRALQRNMVRSHAAGAGRALPSDEVRAILLLRANALARGQSGCRRAVVERLLDLLNLGIHPVVPEIGSVGASGDLGPLAHIALALMGEGRAEAGGEEGDAGQLLAGAGIPPLELAEKEGLALVNGTQAVTGIGIVAAQRFGRALDTADVAGAISLEGLRGTPQPFRAPIHSARPHPGQIASARRLRALLAGSEIRESHREGDPRVQDAYSLRCMPQVHGAAREANAYARRILATEANSATDNPLLFPDDGMVLSGGNFHGQVVAQCLDLVAIAAADLASISEAPHRAAPQPRPLGPARLSLARTRHALGPDDRAGHGCRRALRDARSREPREHRFRSHERVPGGSRVEWAWRPRGNSAGASTLLETVLAAEVLCGTQAIEFHRPLKAGSGVERAPRGPSGTGFLPSSKTGS